MRCAIYARYSSDLQRESSIEDQIRRCREYAERRGWLVEEDYVRFDEAVSAAALHGREALQSLVANAKRKPRPFERILIEDTSRLARNLEDALRTIETLRFNGVFIHAVSQGIDSEHKTARQLLTLHGMMDEQYLVGLADKVHRGQQGLVLQGLQPGGRCYGYVNVPIEDPTRPGKCGRPAVSGVRLAINEQEASVVRRIFQMYAEGDSLAGIAKKLNAEGVVSPQPARQRLLRAWCPSSIREMLRNERYRGVQVWNRTVKQRNPETGRKVSRRRPESEWMRVEVPQWRVVPEPLWEAVQAAIAGKQRFGVPCCGGQNRTEQSRRYLFSGLLRCGVCGSRMVIVSGRGRSKRGYTRYGCPSHRYRGVCENGLTIRRERLEAQLLAAIEERVLRPEMMEYALRRFAELMNKRLREMRKKQGSSAIAARQRERKELQEKARRIAEAIAAAGHSPALLAQLASAESELRRVERDIEANKPLDVEAATAEIRDFFSKSVLNLQSVLQEDIGRARSALARHIEQVVLTPRQQPSGPVFEVSGKFELLEKQDVMQMVARDGIEPPTPAFSGLLADTRKPFIFSTTY